MTRLRVEEVADQVIAADAARAGTLDRKGKPGPQLITIEEIFPEMPVGQASAGGGPSRLLIGGLVGLALALLLGGGYALGLFGSVGQPTPPPVVATPPPVVATPPPVAATVPPVAPTLTPSPSPVGLVFPPNTVFEGCIVIDPQGSTTPLRPAFTLSNVQAGEYRGSFGVAPGGALTGTGAGGQNPVIVTMRASRFGTYDQLQITAPDGMSIALGPIAQQVPLEINAATNVRNACDPAALRAPTPQNVAGRAYLEAVAPVNRAAADFAAASASWTSATTATQAQAAAAPLLSALQAAQPQLPVIAATYPPAAQHLMAVSDAVRKLAADLADLSRVQEIGVAAWLDRYRADVGALSAASNQVREDLGVRAIVSR